MSSNPRTVADAYILNDYREAVTNNDCIVEWMNSPCFLQYDTEMDISQYLTKTALSVR